MVLLESSCIIVDPQCRFLNEKHDILFKDVKWEMSSDRKHCTSYFTCLFIEKPRVYSVFEKWGIYSQKTGLQFKSMTDKELEDHNSSIISSCIIL